MASRQSLCRGSRLSAFSFTGSLLLITSMIVLSPGSTRAASKQDGVLQYSPVTGLPRFLSAGRPMSMARPGISPMRAAIGFLSRERAFFGIADPQRELTLRAARRDGKGRRHLRLSQSHKGIPVFAGEMVVHLDDRNRVLAVNGDYFPVPDKFPTRPTVSLGHAVDVARTVLAGMTTSGGKAVVEESRLVVVDTAWYGDPPSGIRLAYYLVLSSENSRMAFFIDAHEGTIIDRWSLLLEAKDRQVYDGLAGSILPGTLVRGEGDPAVGVPADADFAYDYAGDFYDYLFLGHGRDSLDDLGLTLIQTVNSTAPDCPNAFWDGFEVVYCTGAVTDDVMAHEFGHGLTQYTARLIYQNQPGQLNESYSDVIGELVDLFNGGAAVANVVDGPPGPPWTAHLTGPGTDSPNSARTTCDLTPPYEEGVRWLVSEDAAAFGGAIRDMWDPTCFGDPGRANSSLQTCDPLDNGGVHSGSGVPNHAFAMLVDGQTFNGQTVNGIGLIKAGAIWLRALTVYLTRASDFADAYSAVNQACQDLVGTDITDPRTGTPSGQVVTAADCTEVDKALLATEMDTQGACGATVDVLDPNEPAVCAAATRIFFDDMESGAGAWTVSNTGPPTPYDWVQKTAPVVFSNHMAGTAWFAEDRDIGDCSQQDESAVHSLFSPPIVIPIDAEQVHLRFDHYIAAESGYDGGNVKISVNGGAWMLIPPSEFVFNSYNFNPLFVTFNTNPLAGQSAFSSAGGADGQSQIDLSAFVTAGDTIQLRWDFGKDGCTGVEGWYVDNVEVYSCACGNGAVEGREQCDGTADAVCPGKCQADCTCGLICIGDRAAALSAGKEMKARARCNDSILKGNAKCKNHNQPTCADPQLGDAIALAYGANDHSLARSGPASIDLSVSRRLRSCQKAIGKEMARAFGRGIKFCAVGQSVDRALARFGKQISRKCEISPLVDGGTGTVLPDVGAPCGPLIPGQAVSTGALISCLKAQLQQWLSEVCN